MFFFEKNDELNVFDNDEVVEDNQTKAWWTLPKFFINLIQAVTGTQEKCNKNIM